MRVPAQSSLMSAVRKVERGRARKGWLAVGPAVLYVLVAFVIPIVAIFYFAIDTGEVRSTFPRTASALADWEGPGTPGPRAYQALVSDLRAVPSSRGVFAAARELNVRLPGFRSAMVNASREAGDWPEGAGRDELIALDPAWGEPARWQVLKGATSYVTAYRLLAALDLRPSPELALPVAAPAEQRIYLRYLGRTFLICAVVTLLCLVVGYPLAYLIASAPPRWARLLLTLTLLPFWTSILVRTAAWVILLQQHGMVNEFLLWTGLIEQPLTLIYNRFGVYVAMVHVLLPFMVLPIYSVMKGIPKNLMPAAASLGAKPVAAFLQVYLPQSSVGAATGCLITFILALGYYVTPALVGGATDQMESGLIAHFALEEGNWGMAASLAAILLLCVVLVYLVYRRLAKAAPLRAL